MSKQERKIVQKSKNPKVKEEDEDDWGFGLINSSTLTKQKSTTQKEADAQFLEFWNQYMQLKVKVKLTNDVSKIMKLVAEDDEGDTEYKLKFADPSQQTINKRMTQMKKRIETDEGGVSGIAYYIIGVEDNGNPLGLQDLEMYESLKVLFQMATALDAFPEYEFVKQGYEGFFTKVKIEKNKMNFITRDIKILMIGAEGVGKSTIVGVLTSGQKDNGQGGSRTFTHKHELQCGQTTMSYQILGFDASGKVTNYDMFHKVSLEEIIQNSSKLITFIDCGGNEKYFRATMKGITSFYPDYALVAIDACKEKNNKALSEQTQKFLNISMELKVPLIILITKIDLVKDYEISDVKDMINSFFSSHTGSRPIFIDQEENLQLAIRNLQEELQVVVLQISSKTLAGMPLFSTFLNQLPFSKQNEWDKYQQQFAEFQIQQTFKKLQNVVVGLLYSGTVQINNELLIGPFSKGQFELVKIQEIRCNTLSVKKVLAGQLCSFKLQFDQNLTEKLRPGMVIVDPKCSPKASWIFSADLTSYNGQKQILNQKFEASMNIAHVRQLAKIVKKEEFEDDEMYDSSSHRDTSDMNDSMTEGEKYKQIQQESNHNSQQEQSKQEDGNENEEEEKQSTSNEHSNPQQQLQRVKSQETLQVLKNQIMIYPKKRTRVVFQFINQPEYLKINDFLIINQGEIKIIGQISQIFFEIESLQTLEQLIQAKQPKKKSFYESDSKSGGSNSKKNLIKKSQFKNEFC